MEKGAAVFNISNGNRGFPFLQILCFCLWSLRAVNALSFNPFPNKPWFLLVCSTRLLKTMWEKEKLLITSNLSFFHSVFYPFGVVSTIFIKFETVVCKLFQFGRV